MKTNIFLAALPSHDNRLLLIQKMDACEAKRSPLIRIQWTQANDLHVTLGFISSVEESDIRLIASSMLDVSQTPTFMAHIGEVKLYGNAIVLRVEPYHQFFNVHQKMNHKLSEKTTNRYAFESKKRYDPHMTIGRIRNLPALNFSHKQQLMHLIETQFRSCSFLIQQARLLRRLSTSPQAPYQVLKQYNLSL